MTTQPLLTDDSTMTPSILYKYRSWKNEYHQKILTQNKLYFSSPEGFNDPFDNSIPIRYDKLTDKQHLDGYFKYLTQHRPDLSRAEKRKIARERVNYINTPKGYAEVIESQRRSRNSAGIFSLTKYKNNLLMWSHYGNNHRGFCIGFYTKGLTSKEKWPTPFLKVKYEKEYPNIQYSDPSNERIIRSIVTKSKDWKYEKEYRSIWINSANTEFSIQDTDIAEVILGCKMDNTYKEEIKAALKKKRIKIPVFQAKMKKQEFGLDFEEITY